MKFIKPVHIGIILIVVAITSGCGMDIAGFINKSGVRKKVYARYTPNDLTDRDFYRSLEQLLYKHGVNPANWPLNKNRMVVENYLLNVCGLELGDCEFGKNLLGYGVHESPEKAQQDLKKGKKDAWGMPYDHILASSPTGSKFHDFLISIGISQGAPLYNRELASKAFVVLKADCHSLFAEVFRRFNGLRLNIIAREINIIGAPSSADTGYTKSILPALSHADCIKASIYVCNDDKVPRIIPGDIRKKALEYGIDLPEETAVREDKGILKKIRVKKIHLKGCGHDIEEYFPGIRATGSTMLIRD